MVKIETINKSEFKDACFVEPSKELDYQFSLIVKHENKYLELTK